MFFHFVWQFAGPYFGVYQVQALGATSQVIGWLAIVSSLARILGQAVWGRAVDQRGSQWVFTLCLLLIPIIPFIWLPLTAAWQVIFVNIPSGFLWAGQEAGNFNLILELAGKDGRGEDQKTQAIASYHTLMAVANVLGPLAGGLVIQSLGYRWTFALSGFGRMAAAVMFLLLLRPFDLRRLGRRSPAAS
jgi:MFS family permease